MIELTVSFDARDDATFVAPLGLSTPQSAPFHMGVQGADWHCVFCPATGQPLASGRATDDRVTLTYAFGLGGGAYPNAMFTPRDSKFARAAGALSEEARDIAAQAGGGRAGILAIMAHTAQLFDYGHPDSRYYDGEPHIPQLCTLTEGSCVDINIYLLAALRSAGYEAGYVTGYFVPSEKRTWCEDSHCWVVTRHEGRIEEWDIAHFLKMGRRDIEPGLNPKPGVRLAMAHSMGWTVPALGIEDAKLMGPPGWVLPDGTMLDAEPMDIWLTGYDDLAAA